MKEETAKELMMSKDQCQCRRGAKCGPCMFSQLDADIAEGQALIQQFEELKNENAS